MIISLQFGNKSRTPLDGTLKSHVWVDTLPETSQLRTPECYSRVFQHCLNLDVGMSPVWWCIYLFLAILLVLEKEMATHSSVLAWRIPGTGVPDRLPSMGSHRVRHDWSDLAAAAYYLWIFQLALQTGSRCRSFSNLVMCVCMCVYIYIYIFTHTHTHISYGNVYVCVLVAWSSLTHCDPMDWSLPGSMKFSRQEYWSELPFPSPGNFPTEGSNPGLLYCRHFLYHLSHQGSPLVMYIYIYIIISILFVLIL